MAKIKNQRKRSVVDARVQWTLASRVLLHFCVFIVAGAVFGLITQFLSDPFQGLNGHMRSYWSNNGPYMVALLCLLPIFIRDTLKISNKMAGPICRLRDTVDRLAKGEDVAPLKFRKGDMWDDLPEKFNQMVDELRASGGSQSATTQSDDSESSCEKPELVEV